MSARDPNCPLCLEDGGSLLWRGPHLRVIEVNDADYPGFHPRDLERPSG